MWNRRRCLNSQSHVKKHGISIYVHFWTHTRRRHGAPRWTIFTDAFQHSWIKVAYPSIQVARFFLPWPGPVSPWKTLCGNLWEPNLSCSRLYLRSKSVYLRQNFVYLRHNFVKLRHNFVISRFPSYQNGSCSSISRFPGGQTGSCSSISRFPGYQNGSFSSISRFPGGQTGSFSNISRCLEIQSEQISIIIY